MDMPVSLCTVTAESIDQHPKGHYRYQRSESGHRREDDGLLLYQVRVCGVRGVVVDGDRFTLRMVLDKLFGARPTHGIVPGPGFDVRTPVGLPVGGVLVGDVDVIGAVRIVIYLRGEDRSLRRFVAVDPLILFGPHVLSASDHCYTDDNPEHDTLKRGVAHINHPGCRETFAVSTGCDPMRDSPKPLSNIGGDHCDRSYRIEFRSGTEVYAV